MEWLLNALKMNPQGGADPATFGALGSSGPAINNGMPMSGLGPAGGGINAVNLYAPPGSNVNPGTPGVVPGGAPAGSPMNSANPLAGFASNGTNGGGPLGMLGGLINKFSGIPGSAPAGNAPGTSSNPAMSIAQSFLQQPQITPATFNWNMLPRRYA